eukprot:683582-Prymnesium_polylepis.1
MGRPSMLMLCTPIDVLVAREAGRSRLAMRCTRCTCTCTASGALGRMGRRQARPCCGNPHRHLHRKARHAVPSWAWSAAPLSAWRFWGLLAAAAADSLQ